MKGDGGMNVLVIDDEPLILNLLKRAIHQEGHSVALAKNGAEALELVKSQNFDLILTDLWLSDVSALELLTQLRNFCWRIVLMSGASNSEEIQGHHEEILQVLNKPFSIKDISSLLKQIQAQLGKNSKFEPPPTHN